MKQYTTPEQTAKLIELGFEKPSSIASVEPIYGMGGISVAKAYSIGELIEMLPNTIWIDETIYSKVIDKNKVFYYSWTLQTYAHALLRCDVSMELVENLYDMCVQLKKKRVI